MKHTVIRSLACLIVLLGWCSLSFAESTTHEAASVTAAAEQVTHPDISADGSWAGAMVIVTVLMFVAAGVIGPIVRTLNPPEVPPAHSHDEPPGSSGHHGGSGTVDQDHHHGH